MLLSEWNVIIYANERTARALRVKQLDEVQEEEANAAAEEGEEY